MKKTALIALVATSLFACKDTPKPAETAATPPADTAQTASRGLENTTATLASKPPDSVVVEISERGIVTMDKREVNLDDLQKKLVDTVKTLKKKNGKAPDTIIYRSHGAMMGVRGAVKDAIQDAKTELKKQ